MSDNQKTPRAFKNTDRVTVRYNNSTRGFEAASDAVEYLEAVVAAERINSQPTYQSASSGTIFISDMETKHIIYAIRKLVREWAESLPVTHDLVHAISAGLGDSPNHKTILDLTRELEARFWIE